MHIQWLNELNVHLNNYFLEGRAASQSSWELFSFSNFLSQPCIAAVPEMELMALNHKVQVASNPRGCVPLADEECSQYFPLFPYLRKAPRCSWGTARVNSQWIYTNLASGCCSPLPGALSQRVLGSFPCLLCPRQGPAHPHLPLSLSLAPNELQSLRKSHYLLLNTGDFNFLPLNTISLPWHCTNSDTLTHTAPLHHHPSSNLAGE